MKNNVIVFRISGKLFCFPMEKIPLVIRISKVRSSISDLNTIPESIDYLLEEIKIINLQKILNIAQRPIQETGKLLVGEYGNVSVGFFVDKVVSIMKTDDSEILKNEDTKNEKFVEGILGEDNSIKFLNVDEILKSEIVLRSIQS